MDARACVFCGATAIYGRNGEVEAWVLPWGHRAGCEHETINGDA